MSKEEPGLHNKIVQWEPPPKVVQQQLRRLQDAFTSFQLPPPPDNTEQSTHKIALLAREEDHTAVILAGMGFSFRAISVKTGLSIGQISLRCKRAGVSVRAYRDGVSPFAIAVMDRSAEFVSQLMTHHLRQREARKVPNYKKYIDI